MEKPTVGVIFGGISTEHEVSVITGLQILNNIDQEKYNVLPLYVSKQGKWYTSNDFYNPEPFKDLVCLEEKYTPLILNPLNNKQELFKPAKKIWFRLKPLRVDIFFPCFHGGLGENGGFQGLFEIANIPYVGSGIAGSILGMDKVLMRQIFQANNIPQAPYMWFYRNQFTNNKSALVKKIEEKFSYPLFIKPANSGSSVGVARVTNRGELKEAIEVAATLDQKIVVEKAIGEAKEINISVIGNSGERLDVSACEEVLPSGKFLDYEQKYAGNGKSKGMASTKREIPAAISTQAQKKVTNLAKNAFSSLNCHGLARVDFLVDEKKDKYYVLEVNTIPGSLAFYLWEAVGLSFKNMLTKLIGLSLKRFEEERKTTKTFASNILQNFDPSLKTPKN